MIAPRRLLTVAVARGEAYELENLRLAGFAPRLHQSDDKVITKTLSGTHADERAEQGVT